MKNEVDGQGHPMYKRDENGVLPANFNALKANDNKPFVFPIQMQQVFYYEKLNMPW